MLHELGPHPLSRCANWVRKRTRWLKRLQLAFRAITSESTSIVPLGLCRPCRDFLGNDPYDGWSQQGSDELYKHDIRTPSNGVQCLLCQPIDSRLIEHPDGLAVYALRLERSLPWYELDVVRLLEDSGVDINRPFEEKKSSRARTFMDSRSRSHARLAWNSC